MELPSSLGVRRHGLITLGKLHWVQNRWRTVTDAPTIWRSRLRNRQFGAAIKGNENTDGWEASLDKKTASLADLDGSRAMFIWKMLPDGLN